MVFVLPGPLSREARSPIARWPGYYGSHPTVLPHDRRYRPNTSDGKMSTDSERTLKNAYRPLLSLDLKHLSRLDLPTALHNPITLPPLRTSPIAETLNHTTALTYLGLPGDTPQPASLVDSPRDKATKHDPFEKSMGQG